ncbi:unnamed protein product [Acanthoscelides obtectus]|uniref:Coiled-coil domain-containing protein 12 n=1 Tax=Acanthoscelides obtectus TaxID=200917 RepID=A0A9P0JWG0_ACAOB|nr:unnamed protein product [Acanthoscelides obtectus]CAH2011960.1 unnamed protein product [Acanthoscelides obtectus]CAK1646990.1 Coiled-coil domain-containing protein 12 [Acanthoscelides obtectus]CAK1682383.1 Coiled-coil domain-containing protein 12 [Acanthoscelides obtectus]
MMAGEQNIGHLEDEALKRRERLKALKRKREGDISDGKEKSEDNSCMELPKPIFRSYRPANEELNDFTKEPSIPGDVTAEIKDHLEAAKSSVVIDQLDVTALAPRKPDWDLKRDVARKLARLERQTQRAIAELIRDRLKERSRTDDLAAMVNAAVSDQVREQT